MSGYRYKNISPGNLFSDADAARYEEWHEDIYDRVRAASHTISSLECLAQYPLDEMFTGSECHFWGLMAENFWSAAVVTLDGLMDSKKSRVTIPQLQELTLSFRWLDAEARDSYERAIQEAELDERLLETRNLVRKFRNLVYAHRFTDGKTGRISEPKHPLDMAKLCELYSGVERHFGICSVGDRYDTTPFLFSPNGWHGKKGDPPGIKTILDAFLQQRLNRS